MVIDIDMPYKTISECHENKEYANTNEEMSKRVLDLSKGLAKVRE